MSGSEPRRPLKYPEAIGVDDYHSLLGRISRLQYPVSDRCHQCYPPR